MKKETKNWTEKINNILDNRQLTNRRAIVDSLASFVGLEKENWQKELAEKRLLKIDDGNITVVKCENCEKLKEALIWCSGSGDFQEGGKARKGWLKICQSLLKEK